ncbi:helix-turn-helix transcriptional regulator [Fibrella forsythiae]|uniref:Helix-turn-helix transcriptional regulator n=1 Tax=Fibrella forsythiae TaxID=2817061 RepID=A0ABS3JTB1_9BACT|nr:helix-turn-helix transcriptional regulator [Fibrella forsythiae]MBO0953245.1 helix-turn-helix transcriptional regulator [Fibrella forsythiae]
MVAEVNYFCGMSEALQKSVGNAVKEARIRAGLSQKELAVNVGLQQPNIAKLEAGGYNISLNQLERIAQVLRLNVEVILTHSASA